MGIALPPSLAQLLAGATPLTRRGDLMQATAAIQRALGAGPLTHARSAANAGGVVLDGLVSELRRPDGESANEAPLNRDAGTHFREHLHATASGSRTYKVFSPGAAAAASPLPLPLLVMLHGCTQNPDDFAAGTRMNQLAEREGWVVLYPAQAPRSNTSKCWNWFNPGDQRRGVGEPALLAAMTHEVMARCAIDPQRVYIAGLSAGGAMAAIMGREYSDLYAAVGVHSGLPHGAASDVASAFAVMKSGDRRHQGRGQARAVPTIVFHGDNDPTVHPANGRHVIADALASDLGAASTISRASGPGRPVTRTVYADASGRSHAEHWEVHGAGHAWSGGSASGSYTDPQGPDASAEMLRFFLEHPRRG